MKISTGLLKNMEFIFLAVVVLTCGALYAKSHKLPSQAHSNSYAKLHTSAPIAANSHMMAPIAKVKNLSSSAVQTVVVLAKRIR